MEILLDQVKYIWSFLSTPLFQLGNSQISLASLFVALMILAGFAVISKIIERGVHNALKSKAIDSGVKGSIERFSRYLIITLGAFIAFDTIGISLSSLAALGAVLMVGIGFGLQNIAQNFVSGIIILLERPIKKGDIVNVGGVSGKVRDIRVRSTVIETRDDVAIITTVRGKLFEVEWVLFRFSRSERGLRLVYRSKLSDPSMFLVQRGLGTATNARNESDI